MMKDTDYSAMRWAITACLAVWILLMWALS